MDFKLKVSPSPESSLKWLCDLRYGTEIFRTAVSSSIRQIEKVLSFVFELHTFIYRYIYLYLFLIVSFNNLTECFKLNTTSKIQEMHIVQKW